MSAIFEPPLTIKKLHIEKSEALFNKAQQYLVGGVNSPVRAFQSVGGTPLFIESGKGAYITDADNNHYIDYVGAFGPLILGHGHPAVNEAISKAMEKGVSFGATTENEIQLAALIQEAFPAIELIRFVNSGTEATMSALRLARAFTGKNKIIKFAGCYHGHSDFLLVEAGSGLATLSLPGVPPHVTVDTLIAPFNDIEYVENLFEIYAGQIAAVILEPVPGNMGLVLPAPDFLKQIRDITYKNEALLITDEIMSGFRERFGGAQHYFNIVGDITCLGKIIGGGLAVGAYGGKKEIMQMIAPLGPVYQAGTLSGNPLAMAAGIATLKILKSPAIYSTINAYTARLSEDIQALANRFSIHMQLTHFGSMLTPFINSNPVHNYTEAKKSNTALYGKLFHRLLENGVYPPPSQFETWFVSSAMTEKEYGHTMAAFEKAFQTIISG